jgi:hypothetical protein
MYVYLHHNVKQNILFPLVQDEIQDTENQVVSIYLRKCLVYIMCTWRSANEHYCQNNANFSHVADNTQSY